jgi:hypothetical protein
MPKFNNPKEIMEYVVSEENRNRVKSDYKNYLMYNGQLTGLIQDAMAREYILPETLQNLNARTVPINITQKIIGKLAQVYRNPPTRKPVVKQEDDQDLIDFYAKEWNLNRLMKFANTMFKNNKNVVVEPFLDYEGKPSQRAVPSHNYTIVSNDYIDPTRMTGYIKHWIIDPKEKANNRYIYWSEAEHLILNEEGSVMTSEMAQYEMDGTNPYGVIPATYIKDSEDRLVPLVEEDLPRMQILICILLSDLAYASKYQCWSTIAVFGDGIEKRIPFNPSSTLTLGKDDRVEVIKPEVDIPEMLQQIKENMGMLLSSKGLKASSMDSVNADNAAAGIAKLIDSSETTEVREDQEAFFRAAEEELWDKFAHNIHPVWASSKEIHPDYKEQFSEEFELSISFPDMGIPITPSQKIDDVIKLVNAGLISKTQAIKEVYPEFTEDEIKDKLLEVNREGLDNMKFFERNMGAPNEIQNNQTQKEAQNKGQVNG